MAKQGIFTGSSPNDGTGDSLALGAIKVNQNFDEVYSTFGDGNNLISYVDTAGVSTVAGNLTGNPSISVTKVVGAATSSVIPFLWSNYSDLPAFGDVHGAVAHVHETGKLYYAHGRWVELVNTNDDSTVGTGTENYNVGVITATTFYGDGSQLTGIAATGGGGGIGTDGSVNTTGIITASAFVGDGSGLTGISADSAWVNINLSGDHGATLGIHTTKNVGIGTTSSDAYRLTVNGIGSGPGTPGEGYGIRVESRNFSLIENVGFNYGKITVPAFLNLVGGDQNGWNRYPLQMSEVEDPCLRVQSHARFRTTAQFGTSFYEYGSTGPILYPGIMIDGGKSTISVGFGISLNGQSGVITATEFRGYGGIFTGNVNVSGAITATSFSGDGSGLTGISTFSGDYNDLINQPSIPSISGLASEGYVDAATANSANWDTAYSWGDHSTAGYITTSLTINGLADVNAGAPTTGHVLKWSGTQWISAADQTAAGAGIGLSDLSVTITSAGINSLTYNNVTGVFEFTPTDVSGFSTFSGDYNDLTNQPSIPSISGLASEGYVDNAVSTKADLDGANFTGVVTATSFSGSGSGLTNVTDADASSLLVNSESGNAARVITFAGTTAANVYAGVLANNNFKYNPSTSELFVGTGVTIRGDSGIVSATSFSGDGSALTGITTSQIVGYSGGGGGGSIAGIDTTGTSFFNQINASGIVTASRFESSSAGTPTIDSPNNVNINAVTVAISTNLTVGTSVVAAGQTINSTGVQVTGVVTATSFVGDGSNLTGVTVTETDTLASVTIRGNTTTDSIVANYYENNDTAGDGSDRGYCIKYYVTANGFSAYRFAGPGLLNTTDNPAFYLQRGFTYMFENSTGTGHPFRIQFTGTTTGVGTYVQGSQTGTQYFTVPFDAPSSYEYECTLHSSMKGTFNVA